MGYVYDGWELRYVSSKFSADVARGQGLKGKGYANKREISEDENPARRREGPSAAERAVQKSRAKEPCRVSDASRGCWSKGNRETRTSEKEEVMRAEAVGRA